MTDLSQASDAELLAAATMPALIGQESSGRVGVVGPQTQYGRAEGMTQMLPATARAMAVKLGLPWQPGLLTSGTAEGAAYQQQLGQAYLQEGLDHTGNLPDALRYYHGGPDRAQWGPKTNAYADAVLSKAGYSPAAPQADLSGASDADLMAAAGIQPASTAERATGQRLTPADMAAFARGAPQGGDGPLKQFATGLVEGGKPIADKVAEFLGVPEILRSSAVPNAILHAMGRQSMPVATAPQNAAQSLGRTAGQMAVGAAAPGSIAARAAAVVGPTLGSEGAGTVFKGTPMEQPARMVGAAVGGMAAGGIAGAVDNAALARANPRTTPAQLRQQANSLYTEMRNRDVQFTPAAVNSLAEGLNDTVGDLHTVYPTEAKWAETVAKTLASDPTASTLDTLRSKMQQALTTPTASRTPDQLRIGKALVDEVDSFMDAAARHPQTMTTGTGDPAKVGQLLGDARDLWKRMRNVQTVENLAESAGIRNGTTHAMGNGQNFTAQKLRELIDPTKSKTLAGLTSGQQQQLRDVILGTPVSNGLKLAGNLSPTKGLGMMSLALGPFTGGMSPLVTGPLGYAANLAGRAAQQAQLESLLRSLATKGGAPSSPSVLNAALRTGAIGGVNGARAPQRITQR